MRRLRRRSSSAPRRRSPPRSLSPALIFSLASPYFLTLPNFVNLIEAYSVTTILAAGVFVVLVSGGIDISFTATAAATQYLAATLAATLRLAAAANPRRSPAAVGHRPRQPQRAPHLLPPRRLDHRHHRDVEHLLRAADLLHRRARDLQPARLVGRAAWSLFRYVTAAGDVVRIDACRSSSWSRSVAAHRTV